ncbi:MAG: DUF1592 domain-containing protein, partial [Pirellula sp.]
VLVDPQRSTGADRDLALQRNRRVFNEIAKLKEGDQFRLLLKVAGGLDHGGEDVLPLGSTGHQLLTEFVRRANQSASPSKFETDHTEHNLNMRSLFDGVVMLEDRLLLRRSVLSLSGRLPTDDENNLVVMQGLSALPSILESVMQEDAFLLRLREAFNDIFLTLGYDDGAESALAYDHFSKTRHWTQTHDLNHIEDENLRRKARYKVTDDYRAALLGEPMKLIEYIVRNDRPFTEIVTADYIMVTPYTARGYGIYDELKGDFQNPDDPFEYIPVKLKALVGRNQSQNQDSETGFYPHAGLLSTFQYLRRYPTTETNRNRLRARMFLQHFLGIDAMELAARVSDAASVTAKYENPTMQAAECVVCHKTVDPIAGLFQDYFKIDGVYGRRKEGWFKDMFAPGLEAEELPLNERWRSLQWLGERTARDPRFASAMVEHVYYILTGRKVLLPPKELDDPLYASKRRAYQEQRCQIDSVAIRFTQSSYNLKGVFRDWIMSDFYRADRLETNVDDASRRSELNEIGVMRLLSPEQLERKLKAIFGESWGKLNDQLAMLYGGIDSKEVTERALEPSGAMGAIQRIMANDVACRHTLRDFSRPPSQRKLFPAIEPDVLPNKSPENTASIRRAIQFLHERLLGRYDAIDSPEVDGTYKLFVQILDDAHKAKGIENRESYTCRQNLADAPADPKYTIRAWRGVITYLLRRPEFLYE